jgi:uncharacterized membrane protein
MTFSAKSEWLIPAGLIALSFVPVLVGSIRFIELGSGAQITPDNARYFASPLPIMLHIVSVTIYCVLGAFQFSADFRRRNPKWHRTAGRILVPCGLIVAVTGLWMTQFYPTGTNPPASFDGPYLYAIRLLVGSAMILFICLGFAAIKRRDISHHRAWMMRSYALGIAAGTQAFTHLPWFLFPSIQGELARTLLMLAGWVINLAVVEWILLRGRLKAV